MASRQFVRRKLSQALSLEFRDFGSYRNRGSAFEDRFAHWLRSSLQSRWPKRDAKNLEASDFRKPARCVRRHEGQHSSRHLAIAEPIDRRGVSYTHFDRDP